MKVVYTSTEHEFIVEPYLDLVHTCIKELTNGDKHRYKEFMEVAYNIIDYHNGYSETHKDGNYYDFLAIIPVNYLVMVTGFLAGYKNDDNKIDVQINKHLITQYSHRVVDDLAKLKTVHE